jgi:mono/diheme cytochrome c family protein
VTSLRWNVSAAIRHVCRRGVSVVQLLALLWLGGCGGVFTEIPELNTADGRVFAQRCGACHGKPFGDHGITHGVPDPRFRTMEEWQKELSRMEGLMREKGLPPLTEPEREAIVRYLSRHAKSSSG